MHDRLQIINHHGKQILVVNMSHCSAAKVEEIARAVPDYVTTQARNSVLLLTDFSGASFNGEAVRTMKETAVFDKPYVKKTCWVGAENLPEVFEEEIKTFSRREFAKFKNRKEALDWLVED